MTGYAIMKIEYFIVWLENCCFVTFLYISKISLYFRPDPTYYEIIFDVKRLQKLDLYRIERLKKNGESYRP